MPGSDNSVENKTGDECPLGGGRCDTIGSTEIDLDVGELGRIRAGDVIRPSEFGKGVVVASIRRCKRCTSPVVLFAFEDALGSIRPIGKWT